jgi:KaiC/GvpD/RAD55 family RecA-like ATPase
VYNPLKSPYQSSWLEAAVTEPTGITALDHLLGGGIPRPSATGVIGSVGSGKSTLAQQLVVNMLQRDFRVLYYAIDEPASDVKTGLGEFGLDAAKYEDDGHLAFVDIFSLGVERLADAQQPSEPENIVDTTFKFSDLVSQGRNFTLKHLGRKQFVVLDSLTPFFLMVDAKRVFQFGQVLKYATRFARAIGIAVLHTKVLNETIENAMVSFADVVLELEKKKPPDRSSPGGTLRLVKLGKSQVSPTTYSYEITSKGMEISQTPLA